MLEKLRKDRGEEGFTLIELLVVIIIIGILAAIAIPVFLNQRSKGWDAAVQSDLRNAATAQETWLTEGNPGQYTSNVAGPAVLGLQVLGWRQLRRWHCGDDRDRQRRARLLHARPVAVGKYFFYDSVSGPGKKTVGSDVSSTPGTGAICS